MACAGLPYHVGLAFAVILTVASAGAINVGRNRQRFYFLADLMIRVMGMKMYWVISSRLGLLALHRLGFNIS